MEKKAKVKLREFWRKTEYKGDAQYKFFVTFENDEVKYLYSSSQEDPKYFKTGQEQEYTYELKTGEKDGKKWEMHIVKPVYPKGNYGGGGNYQMSIEDFLLREKIKTVGFSMSYAVKLQGDRGFDKKTIEANAKDMLNWQATMMDKVIKSK